MAEAESVLANENLRKAQEEAKKAEEAVEVPQKTTPSPASQTLTTTQLLMVISIGVSLVGIYYKREEIKKLLPKLKAPAQTAPTPPPVDKTPKKGGIRSMA